ncbi:MAG: hypothetical protein Q7R97_05330 [Candidatus Daviesbacteria bacterium]|nr:hypothetical protein [Candidatus Daviesbacteria bacterium]
MTLYINTKDPKIVTVELKENGKMVKSLSEENEYGSQVLLPLILKLIQLQPRGLDMDILEGIEVEEGPGSFTGLRVGASVAQALGFALNIPVNGKLNKLLVLSYT